MVTRFRVSRNLAGKALHLPAAYGHEVTGVADSCVFAAFILVCVGEIVIASIISKPTSP